MCVCACVMLCVCMCVLCVCVLCVCVCVGVTGVPVCVLPECWLLSSFLHLFYHDYNAAEKAATNGMNIFNCM